MLSGRTHGARISMEMESLLAGDTSEYILLLVVALLAVVGILKAAQITVHV